MRTAVLIISWLIDGLIATWIVCELVWAYGRKRYSQGIAVGADKGFEQGWMAQRKRCYSAVGMLVGQELTVDGWESALTEIDAKALAESGEELEEWYARQAGE